MLVGSPRKRENLEAQLKLEFGIGEYRKARRSSDMPTSPHFANNDFRRSSLMAPSKPSWGSDMGNYKSYKASSFGQQRFAPDVIPEHYMSLSYAVPQSNAFQQIGDDDFRANSCSSSTSTKGVKKGSWTKEEDALLLQHGSIAHSKNWTEIADKIPGRTAKQCRERWCFNLDPSINKDLWSPHEDLILIHQQEELGNKWAQIAQLLPGRTENAVKTRFKSIVRAQKREWHPSEDERLLELFKQHGTNWENIALALGSNRTKHAVKMRFKDLQTGLELLEEPEFGSARQTVREKYYPRIHLKQLSERYKAIAAGAEASNSNAAAAKFAVAPAQISHQQMIHRVESLKSFGSEFWVKSEQCNSFAFNPNRDPLDEFLTLYTDEEPMVFA